MIKRIFAFDECSILNQCEVNIPKSHRIFVGKDFLKPKNSSKLNVMVSKIDSMNFQKYKFTPSNFETNIIKVARELIEEERINVSMLGLTFEAEIIDQLEEFISGINQNYQNINKSENIGEIKTFFINHERELKKERNIPEDDDLMIIAGYDLFETNSKKNLVSADEHFWGYADLIENKYKIFIIKEWECHNYVNNS